MTFLSFTKDFLVKSNWLVLGTVILFFISISYHNKVFATHFVDEEDNFVLGNFLLKDQKLYSDLFSHHQPLAYVFSAGFQSLTNPQDIYSLVKSHREFMIVWSFLWCVLLVWRFKEKVILPLIIFEVTKFYLLGNLFLSESLSVYLILYLALILFEQHINLKYGEYFFLGLLIGFSALLLAPVWPFLLGYLGFIIWFKKIKTKQFLYIFAGVLLTILLTLPFIDIYYYFHNTFYINFKYYIPQSAEEKLPWSLIKSFFSPLTALINSGGFGTLGLVLKITAVFFILSVGFLITKKNFRVLIAAIMLLTLANFRYYTPGLEYSAGFHLLVWYGLFTLIAFYFLIDWISNLKNKIGKTFLVLLVSVGVLTIILSSKDLLSKNDLEKDYQLNYSKPEIFGEAIKIMKNSNDTLFVIPDEWLLYFQGDIKNNNKMVNFYGWMSLVWELDDPVIEKFKTDPPAFFYCDCKEETVYHYSSDYHLMIRNGSKTSLWVLNGKFINLNEDQKNRLRILNFQLE